MPARDKIPETQDVRYWIAINGPTCALSALPWQNPMATPTPEQLLGFPTLEEQFRLCTSRHLRIKAEVAKAAKRLQRPRPS